MQRTTIRPTIRPLASLVFAVTLTAASASAQDLTAEVVRNPDDTVTYTIDLQGPPGGGVWLSVFALPQSLSLPYSLPGLLGELYLDPLTMVIGPTVVLTPQGLGTLQFSYPLTSFDQIPIYSQALVVDSQGILATSNLSAWYHETNVPGAPLSALSLSNNSIASITGNVAGAPGTQVRIEHISSQGALKGSTTLAVGPTGDDDFALNLNPHIQYCDTTIVSVNQGFGWQPYRMIPWHKE